MTLGLMMMLIVRRDTMKLIILIIDNANNLNMKSNIDSNSNNNDQ